jgi:hypothetical protein
MEEQATIDPLATLKKERLLERALLGMNAPISCTGSGAIGLSAAGTLAAGSTWWNGKSFKQRNHGSVPVESAPSFPIRPVSWAATAAPRPFGGEID